MFNMYRGLISIVLCFMNTEEMPISNNLQEEITFFFVQFRLLPPAQVKIGVQKPPRGCYSRRKYYLLQFLYKFHGFFSVLLSI